MSPVSETTISRWWQTLTIALAAGYLVIGVLSPASTIRWPFIVGAVLVAVSLVVANRSRPTAWAVLVIGALAPVATTWWSVIGPVTALLILVCGTAAILATRGPARRRARSR
jgi:hypothetical protein